MGKVRFYSLEDLQKEIGESKNQTIRLQFLQRNGSSKFNAGGSNGSIPILEFYVIITFRDNGSVYRYENLFYHCPTFDINNHAKEIEKVNSKITKRVRELFKDWTIKTGVYET